MYAPKVTTVAREAMDRLTDAAFGRRKDLDAVAACYTDNAVLVSPDQGEAHGRAQIVEYWRHFVAAFPDSRYHPVQQYVADETAIDEGLVTGTNTAPISMPSGQALPPTGNMIRIRTCDIAKVSGGLIVEHHVYFDQLSFLAQLGIIGETAGLSRPEA